jgi:hypothetical protein
MLRLVTADSLMIDGEPLGDEAVQIVDALGDTLFVYVTLIDLAEEQVHARMSSGWFSHRSPVETLGARVLDRRREDEQAFVRVNRRWILRLATRRKRPIDARLRITASEVERVALPPDAMRMAAWAAEKLAHFLPAASPGSDAPAPARGGGRGGGSAELGIPVWWARKARN